VWLTLCIESNDPIAEIPTQESKATVAGWSFLNRYIIMGHENGMVSQWDWKVFYIPHHEDNFKSAF